MPERRSLSLIKPITLSLSKLPLLHRMASNDNGKHKMEEEAESDDDCSDDDSSDSPEEEPLQEEPEEEVMEEEEVSSEVSSMNQLDTSEEKMHARHARGYLFSDTPSTSPDTPPTLGCHRCSNEERSDDDNDDNDF
jgi:hypothetical protein